MKLPLVLTIVLMSFLVFAARQHFLASEKTREANRLPAAISLLSPRGDVVQVVEVSHRHQIGENTYSVVIMTDDGDSILWRGGYRIEPIEAVHK